MRRGILLRTERPDLADAEAAFTRATEIVRGQRTSFIGAAGWLSLATLSSRTQHNIIDTGATRRSARCAGSDSRLKLSARHRDSPRSNWRERYSLHADHGLRGRCAFPLMADFVAEVVEERSEVRGGGL
jgi:hypothetical protein